MNSQEHYLATLPYWLAAQHTPQLGMVTLSKLREQGLSLIDIFQAPAQQLRACGLSPAVIAQMQAPDRGGVERDQHWAASVPGASILTWDHPAYPEQIKHIPDPPMILYALGEVTLLAQASISIVGSRNATYLGRQQAQHFARTLAQAGLVITSGLARGIDGEAHAGALHVHGKTTAVFGTGLDSVYPRQHRQLADAILAGGGVLLSEFPIATPAHRHHFPKRNRIISGLAQGVVVIEATAKSGSLITAQFALEQGREVYALPGAVTNPNAAGCHHLIQQGAALVQTPEDILQALPWYALAPTTVAAAVAAPIRPAATALLSPVASRCLAEIDTTPTSAEVIYQRLGGSVAELQSVLLELELQGVIYLEGGGYARTGSA